VVEPSAEPSGVTEVVLGVNGDRAKLRRILAGPQVSGIVVGHRDRLGRFGVEDREAALAATGRRIIVVNQDEVEGDVVRDMIGVLRWRCACRYGRWSAPVCGVLPPGR
jgi:putative resolvase